MCRKCGAPLKKGNIKVVRPRGKKRPFRVCRRCPQATIVQPVIPPTGQVVNLFGETAAAPCQRPQDTTGGPVVVEGVLDFPPPLRYRFFITQGTAEKIRRALAKPLSGFGIGFEVIPVPEDQVEADPESFAELVEVNVNWKVE